MGLFDRLRNATPAGIASGAAAGVVQGTLGAIGQTAIDIRTAITGEAPLDPDKRAEIEMKLAEIDASVLLAQAETNKIEAQSTSVFVSGWRPMIGWICAIGIGVEFIVRPVADWIAALCGKTVQAPVLDVGQLIALVVSMLGIAAYRTLEKANGSVGLH